MSIAKVSANPWLEPATLFALRDVHEIVQKQLAVAPAIVSNNDGVAEADTTRVVRDDTRALRGLRQIGIVGQRNTFDDENANSGIIPHAGEARILKQSR